MCFIFAFILHTMSSFENNYRQSQLILSQIEVKANVTINYDCVKSTVFVVLFLSLILPDTKIMSRKTLASMIYSFTMS